MALAEILDDIFEAKKNTDSELKSMIINFVQDAQYDEAFVHWLLAFGKKKLGIRSTLLVAVVLDIGLIHRDSFRFFLSFWAICLFKNPELVER